MLIRMTVDSLGVTFFSTETSNAKQKSGESIEEPFNRFKNWSVCQNCTLAQFEITTVTLFSLCYQRLCYIF